jgi:hypothetical protein
MGTIDIIRSLVDARLAESSWDTLLYHGTYKKFGAPNPGSHFGSIDAAKNIIQGVGSRHDTEIRAYKYKPSGKSIDVEDTWGDESPAPHIVKKLHSMGTITKNEHENLQASLKNHPHDHDSIVGRLLKNKGISSVRYKNQEEDVGSFSHIIYDPENLHRVHTFENPNAITHYQARLKQPEFKKRMRKVLGA